MTQNILEIKTVKGIPILDATGNGGNGQMFVPRIGEYVFDRRVVKVNYDYDNFYAKAVVVVE